MSVGNKKQYNRCKEKGICTSCEHVEAIAGEVFCLSCKEEHNEDKRNRTKRIREEVTAHYGGRCACPHCPETNPAFLTLDHLTKEGRERDKKAKGSVLWAKVKKMGFPNDVCLHCWNCNCARAFNKGICPHVEMDKVFITETYF